MSLFHWHFRSGIQSLKNPHSICHVCFISFNLKINFFFFFGSHKHDPFGRPLVSHYLGYPSIYIIFSLEETDFALLVRRQKWCVAFPIYHIRKYIMWIYLNYTEDVNFDQLIKVYLLISPCWNFPILLSNYLIGRCFKAMQFLIMVLSTILALFHGSCICLRWIFLSSSFFNIYY